MDLRWSEEDGLYVPDTASLRLLAECVGRSYMYYAPDGGALLVESGPDSSLLTRVTPAGELAEAYTIPRPEGTYSIHIETGEGWVLADTLDGVYAFDYSGGGPRRRPLLRHRRARRAMSCSAARRANTATRWRTYTNMTASAWPCFWTSPPPMRMSPRRTITAGRSKTATPSSSARTRWAMSACSSCRAASRPSPRSKYRTRWKCAEPRSPAPA